MDDHLHPPFDAQREKMLLNRAQQQTDPEAFRLLYRHYYPRVYAYVASRVARKADAEDLTADVFTQVVKWLKKFEYRGVGSFSAWVFRIAHNRLYQFYTQSRTMDAPLPFESLDELPEIVSDSTSPEGAVARKEQFAHLHALIATLTPRRQEIVTLRYFGGLNNREIAAVLGLDETTIASHLSRALDDLQRRYANSAEETTS